MKNLSQLITEDTDTALLTLKRGQWVTLTNTKSRPETSNKLVLLKREHLQGTTIFKPFTLTVKTDYLVLTWLLHLDFLTPEGT